MILLCRCLPGQLHHGLCHLILPFVSILILHTSRSMTKSVIRASSYRRAYSKHFIKTLKRPSIKSWDSSWEQIWKDGDTCRYSNILRIRQVIVHPSWSRPLYNKHSLKIKHSESSSIPMSQIQMVQGLYTRHQPLVKMTIAFPLPMVLFGQTKCRLVLSMTRDSSLHKFLI